MTCESHVGSNAQRREHSWKPSVGEGQTTHPPTMVEELWVQETLLSLTVVLVTMESKGATVAADTSVEGEGRIEIEGVWSGVDEVEFKGEDAVRSGGDGGRTIDATIVVATVPSGCRCCRRHLSLGHVVSIHLLTMDVGDDTKRYFRAISMAVMLFRL